MRVTARKLSFHHHYLLSSTTDPQLFRLSAIEEAQREACRGTKRQQFLRFARRKWLASDKAAVSVQRVFRGYIGRRRAGLAVEARRLTGEARADWVEVRSIATIYAEYCCLPASVFAPPAVMMRIA